jgi:hypothetical protein
MRESACLRKRASVIVVLKILQFGHFRKLVCLSPISVGLGFRVIPALGGGAQQFQP